MYVCTVQETWKSSTQVLRGGAGIPSEADVRSRLPIENLLEFSQEVPVRALGTVLRQVFQDLVVNRSHLLPQPALSHPNLLCH